MCIVRGILILVKPGFERILSYRVMCSFQTGFRLTWVLQFQTVRFCAAVVMTPVSVSDIHVTHLLMSRHAYIYIYIYVYFLFIYFFIFIYRISSRVY